MTQQRKSRSNRRKSTKISLKTFLILLLIAIVCIGIWAYLHPQEARQKADEILVSLGFKPKDKSPVAPPSSDVNVEVPQSSGKYDNLALGIPGKADCIVEREGYALGYIELHEQPAWVIYKLTAEEVKGKASERGNDFRPDPLVKTGSATPKDYTRSGYDRGHLAPAADMAWSKTTMSESFYMSNMSPQKPQFNRGIWKTLEEQVRSCAVSEKEIYVVTGPILPATKTITIGANKVTVPEKYYKVVFDMTPPQKMIGFILPNEGSNKSLKDFAVSVDAVENATGLDFFSLVPQPAQEQLESTISVQGWKWDN